jgi:hypothetical protein
MQISHGGFVSAEEELSSSLHVEQEEVIVYRLPPEEVESLLRAQYGNKLEAINKEKAEKQKPRHARFNAFY